MLYRIENDILPNALMIGVNYDLFWTLNPKSLKPFIKAFSLKREYEDSTLWSLGAYIRMAVASVMSKSAKYPTRPFGSSSRNEMDMETIKSKFIQKAKQINSKFRKEDT